VKVLGFQIASWEENGVVRLVAGLHTDEGEDDGRYMLWLPTDDVDVEVPEGATIYSFPDRKPIGTVLGGAFAKLRDPEVRPQA
jgi:hypothetical protein